MYSVDVVDTYYLYLFAVDAVNLFCGLISNRCGEPIFPGCS